MNDTDRFCGAITALVTPFTADDAIDYDALDNLLEDQIAAGMTGVVLMGTTGESPTIRDPEFAEIPRFAVERVKGRMLVIIGTGSNSTETCIRESQHAAAVGADGVLTVNPYYNKPTQAGLVAHFMAVANAIDIPIMLYNIAGRTGVNMTTDTLLELAEHPRIIGVKEASGDIQQIMDVIERTPDDFVVLSGDDVLTYPLMALGGDGVISVLSNLVPSDVLSLVNLAREGDWDAAREQHYRLLPLVRTCFIETNPIPIKTALALQGKVLEQFRLPICPIQPANRRKLEEMLASFAHS